MRIAMEFKVPARIRKKGKWFISSCPLLDVNSQGHTRNEAEHNLVDALASFLISCCERGTLIEILHEALAQRAPRLPKGARHSALLRGSIQGICA
jgi:predicted RNase H-like HicB family nuclease